MQHETIIIVSLVITVIFIIFLSITFMNRKSKCKAGEFSLDGKGSFFDPCVKCNKDPVTLVKQFPIGAYQCPMGKFDEKINSGIGLLVSMSDKIPNSIPNMFDQVSNSSIQCGSEFDKYNGELTGLDVDKVKDTLKLALPNCNVSNEPISKKEDLNFRTNPGSVVLFHDDDRIVRQVRLQL